MKSIRANKAKLAVLSGFLVFTLAGCGARSAAATDSATSEQASSGDVTSSTLEDENAIVATTVSPSAGGALDTSDLFTDRDLEQTADTSDATSIQLQSGQDVSITEEGVYVLSGTASDVTVTVDVDSSAKVQLVLDGVGIQNADSPAIYVASADKVFVTTAKGSENDLSVSGSFAADGDTNLDAVIFSKDDLVLNGSGSLNITSSENGVSSHDDLKITGGTLIITCDADGLEANDSILVAGGDITVTSSKDAIHAENDEDNTQGIVYIVGGTLVLSAADDGVHATSVAQIDGGTLKIEASEGIEATYAQVNGGYVSISASDDGINAAAKSSAFTPTIEIRGGDVVVDMGSGDTDALDSNGNLYVSGGTVDITAQFAFDFDGEAALTGGTVYVNGELVTTIENSMMMGGGPGGMGGGPGEMGGEPGGMEGFGKR